MDRFSFVTHAFEAAQKSCRAGCGFPAGMVVAVAAFQSDYGKSDLFRLANNPLAIHLGKGWSGEWLELNSLFFDPFYGCKSNRQLFRKYPSLFDCFRDFGKILEKQHLNIASDPEKFLHQVFPRPEFGDAMKKICGIARRWRLI